MNGIKAGEVLHFYDHISVAVIDLCSNMKVGDSVHFLGHGSDFQQEITSMQIENEPIQQGAKGQLVAVKTIKPVKRGTAIYILTN